MSLFRSMFAGISLLSVSAFAASAKKESVPCLEPFAGISNPFILQETLKCAQTTDAMDLVILNTSNSSYQVPGTSSFFLRSECIGHDKVLNLNYNTSSPFVVDWSDALPNQPGVFRISKTCKQESIAILDTRTQKLRNSTDGSLVNFQVIEDATAGKVTAYVLASEDTGTSLRIRSAASGETLVNVTKTFHNGSPCYANWVVNSTGDLDPTVISYILSWKDNRNLDCSSQEPSDSGMSTGATWGLVILGAVAVAGIGTTIIMCIRERRLAPLRQITNTVYSSFAMEALESRGSQDAITEENPK